MPEWQWILSLLEWRSKSSLLLSGIEDEMSFVISLAWPGHRTVPLLLTWINFIPSMDYVITSIIKCGLKLLIYNRWSLGMDK